MTTQPDPLSDFTVIDDGMTTEDTTPATTGEIVYTLDDLPLITMTPEEARQEVNLLHEDTATFVGAAERLIHRTVRLYQARAWYLLGYSDWAEMAERESLYQLWRTKPERDSLIEILNGEGLSSRAIATIVGISQTTATRIIRSSESNDSENETESQSEPTPESEPESEPEDNTDEEQRRQLEAEERRREADEHARARWVATLLEDYDGIDEVPPWIRERLTDEERARLVEAWQEEERQGYLDSLLDYGDIEFVPPSDLARLTPEEHVWLKEAFRQGVEAHRKEQEEAEEKRRKAAAAQQRKEEKARQEEEKRRKEEQKRREEEKRRKEEEAKRREEEKRKQKAGSKPTRWDGTGTLKAIMRGYSDRAVIHWSAGQTNFDTLCGLLDTDGSWKAAYASKLATHEKCDTCQWLSIPTWLWEALEPTESVDPDSMVENIVTVLAEDEERRYAMATALRHYPDPDEEDEEEEEPAPAPKAEPKPKAASKPKAEPETVVMRTRNKKGTWHLRKQGYAQTLCLSRSGGDDIEPLGMYFSRPDQKACGKCYDALEASMRKKVENVEDVEDVA